MSDRMFASEGDPLGNGGYSYNGGDSRANGSSMDDAAIGIARRLQVRLERHVALLERLYPAPPQLRELMETARRMRRDTESLALLNGDEPGGHSHGPRRLSDVLDDAAAAADETWRVIVRPAAAATISAGASVEMMHVLAEVIDHVTAIYPDAGVGVTSYLSTRNGVSVEVSVTGADRYTPDGLGARRAAATAEAHAMRSRSGVVLQYAPSRPAQNGSGLVASISCPSTAVTIEEPAWASTSSATMPSLARVVTNGNGNGRGSYLGNSAGVLPRSGDLPPMGVPEQTGGYPAYAPAPRQAVDELFGPIVDLPPEPAGDNLGTPIFEAIASAWFQEENTPSSGSPAVRGDGLPPAGPADRAAGPVDWESPSDQEWRAAAARASQPEPSASTQAGLPRRRPGNQLVPPPRSRMQAEEPAERVPDRVRSRLSTYQRGLNQGRHRAPGAEPEGW